MTEQDEFFSFEEIAKHMHAMPFVDVEYETLRTAQLGYLRALDRLREVHGNVAALVELGRMFLPFIHVARIGKERHEGVVNLVRELLKAGRAEVQP